VVLGSAAYLAGTIGLTTVYHVPRNTGLAGENPYDPR
jgi:uncharacterized membrane protein